MLISEVHAAGASFVSNCTELGIGVGTLMRWWKSLVSEGDAHGRSKDRPRLRSHKVSEEEP